MIDKIVHYTNIKINFHSHAKKFDESESSKPVNSIEVKGFIGLLLLLGVTKKNDIDCNEIWSFESLHHSNYATSCMPRERFKFIANYLTFDNIHTREERLAVVRNKRF